MEMVVRQVQRTVVLFAVAALLAAPSAQAAWSTSLGASSVALGPGSNAELVPLFFSVEQSLNRDAPTQADFQLEAERVRVEVDHATAARAATVEPLIPGNTTQDEYWAATFRGLENRAGYRFMVIPGPETRLEVQSSCAAITESDRDQIQRSPLAANPGERVPIETDVSDALAWSGCGAARLRFLGDFVLALWEWDFRATDAAESKEYSTGYFQHDLTSGLPTDAVGQRREAWLFVERGRLDLDITRDSPHYLYASPGARVETESGILFQQAHGMLLAGAEQVMVDGEDVFLQGSLGATLGRSEAGVDAAVDGDLEAWRIDEQGYTVVREVPELASGRVAWMVLGAVAVGVIGFVVLRPVRVYNETVRSGAYAGDGPARGLRQKHRAGTTLLAQRAFEQGRLRVARRLALRSKPGNPAHPDALVIQSRILLARAEQESEETRSDLLEDASNLLYDSMESLKSRVLCVRVLCAVADLHWLWGNRLETRRSIMDAFEQDPRAAKTYFEERPYADILNDFRKPAPAATNIYA